MELWQNIFIMKDQYNPIYNSKNWKEFKENLEPFNKTDQGRIFEDLTLLYLKTEPSFKTKITKIWHHSDIPQEIKLHQAFFQGMVTTIEKENDSYVARFKTDLNNERDLVMSNDPVEEMVNTPSVNEDFMYPLAPFEVGITYMYKGALQFAKISNIKEKESIPLPSQRPQNGRDKGQE